jgi:polyhydroxybutyrate depolymerase
MEKGIDDVKFVNTLLDHLIGKYPVDESRVYVAGMSNGAMLAYRLVCEAPEKFAAVAAVSGTMMLDRPCSAVRAVPFLHIHSQTDTKVPYAGGEGIGGYIFTPVDSAVNVMKSVNACSETTRAEHPGYTHVTVRGCRDNITLETYLLKDGGHSWPGGQRTSARSDMPSTAIKATDVIWQFFNQYKR